MRILRFLSEGLLHAIYRIAWAAFWAQAVAFASAAAFALVGGLATSGWVAFVARAGVVLGATFVLGAILLFASFFRLWDVDADRGAAAHDDPPPPWSSHSVLIALSLIVLSGAALVGARELIPLWRDIFVLLDRAGIGSAFAAGGQFSGLVLLPVMAILYAPALSALASAAQIGLPVLLAVSALTRSPRLGALFTGAAICWSVLVLTAIVAADAFGRVYTVVEPILQRDPDPVAAQVAAELERCSEVIRRAGWMQAAVLLAQLFWLPFVRGAAPRAASVAGAKEPEVGAPATGSEAHAADFDPIEPHTEARPSVIAAPASIRGSATHTKVDLQEAIRRYRERKAGVGTAKPGPGPAHEPEPGPAAEPPQAAPPAAEPPTNLDEAIRRYRERKAG